MGTVQIGRGERMRRCHEKDNNSFTNVKIGGQRPESTPGRQDHGLSPHNGQAALNGHHTRLPSTRGAAQPKSLYVYMGQSHGELTRPMCGRKADQASISANGQAEKNANAAHAESPMPSPRPCKSNKTIRKQHKRERKAFHAPHHTEN